MHWSNELPDGARWYQKIRIVPFFTLIILPICGFVSTIWVPLYRQTALFTVFYVYLISLSITAGYHRLWSHRSYTASTPLRLALAIIGAGGLQGPIRWWAREHRVHHRFTDTPDDPYNIKKGFLHAHILWMLFKQPHTKRRVDISDLLNDPVVAWQETLYVPLALLVAWVAPSAIAGLLWNDWRGGFLYGGIIKMFLVHHGVFSINSVAHYFGDQPYDDRLSPRDNFILGAVSLGEGYHNFHHEFPSDYRNGVKWYHVDVTKWCIWLWGQFGLATDLKRFRKSEIEKANVQQLQKRLKEREVGFYWGPPLDELPVVSWNDFQVEVKSGKSLICVDGVIHDVAGFIDEHPGGKTLLEAYIGKDASAGFNGGMYNHSKVARNVLSTMRTSILRGGCEVEAMKEN